jgi:hypothetical protein
MIFFKKSIYLLLILILVIFVFFIFKPCEPEILEFSIGFNNHQHFKNIIVEEEIQKKLQYEISVWENQDNSSFIYKKNINLWVSKKNSSVNMEILTKFALCDLNDSYTEIDPKKVKTYINDKQYFSNSSNDLFSIEYPIKYSNNDEQEFLISLSYKNHFNTQITLKVYWLELGEFEKLKK